MDANAQRIAELIAEGRKLEAVKLLRETTGMDLQRAMEEVEQLSGDIPDAGGAPGVPEIPAEVRDLALRGNKIEAIKRLRERNPGLGLKEAKDLVDAVPGVPKGSGCAGAMLLFVLALVLAASFI